jgi:hypothetical protein
VSPLASNEDDSIIKRFAIWYVLNSSLPAAFIATLVVISVTYIWGCIDARASWDKPDSGLKKEERAIWGQQITSWRRMEKQEISHLSLESSSSNECSGLRKDTRVTMIHVWVFDGTRESSASHQNVVQPRSDYKYTHLCEHFDSCYLRRFAINIILIQSTELFH